MLMMALLPLGGLLGGYAGDPGGINRSWEKACTCVSAPIRVRVTLATGEYARHLMLATSHSDFSSLAHAPRAWLARCQGARHAS